MSEFANKLKGQWDQLEDSAEQLSKAGKGLYRKASREAEKQFSELVEAGENQKNQGSSIVDQVKTSLGSQFEDVGSSVDQIKLASLGLFTKLRESGKKAFNELVELGEGRESKESQQKSESAAV